jgi:hypothetical protein
MRRWTPFLLFPLLAAPEVARVEIRDRAAAGGYDKFTGRVHFELDPALNRNVRDLALAPRNARGRVEFSADFYVLKPRSGASGTVLFEVPNRGGKGMLSRFNYAGGSLDPRTPEHFGDGFLLEQGLTLAWLGWQYDVPQREGLLRMFPPALAGVRGISRSEFIPDRKTTLMPLSDRGHEPYRIADPASVVLTVRDTVTGRRARVEGFRVTANRDGLELDAGFQPGQIYEATYEASDPPLVGLGLAGVRDLISYLKYDGGELGRHAHAIGFGISQSGRFLRTQLYFGFNTDEKGRRVFDGVWADVAGAGRGSFNHRFAQASRDGYQFFNLFYPTDLFPFTDGEQRDPETGLADGLLVHEKNVPKIFYTNTSFEYWNRSTALVHASLDGTRDEKLGASTRYYYVASAQHGPGRVPPPANGTKFVQNPNDFRPLQRGFLAALLAWVREGKEPPPSRYPTIATKTLAPRDGVQFPAIPGVALPATPKLAWRADYGPDFRSKGIVTVDPPVLGKPFAALVPQVNEDGNELGGVTMPFVAAPLGTHTGWNYRAAETGAPSELAPVVGSFFPFPKTKSARGADPRRSLEERYASREDYLGKVAAATTALVRERFLLERDRERIRKYAGELWDWVMR